MTNKSIPRFIHQGGKMISTRNTPALYAEIDRLKALNAELQAKHDKLLAALVEIRDSNGWIVTEHKYLKLLASEAIANTQELKP